jgi:hypothetical protein
MRTLPLLILFIPSLVSAQVIRESLISAEIPVPMLAVEIKAAIEAQQPVLSPGQIFAFDYYKDDLTTWAITRFERRMDGAGSWTIINLSTGVENPPTGTPPRITITYMNPPPALTTGAHTVEFRACNASACSANGIMAFNALLEPVPVFNIRIVPKPPGN